MQKIKLIRPIFWLIPILLTSLLLGWLMLTRGHLWGDDFAGYLLQTKSLINWNMSSLLEQNQFMNLRSSYSPGPNAYPWGYPLFLLPVYVLVGNNPLAFKLAGLISFLVFLAAFYLIVRGKSNEKMAILATCVLAFSPTLLGLNDLIQSDIPFLAVSTVCLLLILREERHNSLLNKFAIGLTIFLAVFLRTTGILLFVPYGALFISQKKGMDSKQIWVQSLPLLIFLVLYSGQAALFPQGNSSYFEHFGLFSLNNLLFNLSFYLTLPAQFFADLPGTVYLAIPFLVFALIYLFKNRKSEYPFLSFLLVMYLMYSFWPERQGFRFILPAIPVLLLFSVKGIEIVSEKLPKLKKPILFFLIFILVSSLVISGSKGVNNFHNDREINGPFDPYSFQMYDFVKTETNLDDVIVFMKPRALRLFTDRNSFMTTKCDDLVYGDYVSLSLKQEGNNQVSPDAIEKCQLPVAFSEVYKNKRFIVYKIEP